MSLHTVSDQKLDGYGTELRSKIRNGTALTQCSFLSCNCSGKGSRPLDYVHDVILECKTVKKDRNAHMQASNAGNKA